MKTCSTCMLEKDDSCFSRDSKSIDKLNSWCKDCVRSYTKTYYDLNKDTKREKNRIWYQNNKDKIDIKAKNEYTKIFRSKNIEKVLTYNAKRTDYSTLRRKRDELFKLRTNLSSLISQSLKRQNVSKNNKTTEYLGCSIEEFKNHLGDKPRDCYQLDHICPCSQAKTEDELIKLQHYTNFQWLSKEENILKSNKKTELGELMCLKLLGRGWINE